MKKIKHGQGLWVRLQFEMVLVLHKEQEEIRNQCLPSDTSSAKAAKGHPSPTSVKEGRYEVVNLHNLTG